MSARKGTTNGGSRSKQRATINTGKDMTHNDVNGNDDSISSDCYDGDDGHSGHEAAVATGSSSATKISKELEELILDQVENRILGATGRVEGRRVKKQTKTYQHDIKLPEKKFPPKYDSKGVHLRTGKDFCDCLTMECPGCHEPCSNCQSQKCSTECRCNRTWCNVEVITQSPFGPSKITRTRPT